MWVKEEIMERKEKRHNQGKIIIFRGKKILECLVKGDVMQAYFCVFVSILMTMFYTKFNMVNINNFLFCSKLLYKTFHV